MKIQLLDLDINKARRPFPNLALMKLSAFHKARRDEVYLNFPLVAADKTYASCVFTWRSKELPEGYIKGGSGLNSETLPDDIEHIKPDYSLYPNTNFSMGFTSRGCIRHCPFCAVPEKEGSIKAWAKVGEFYDPSYPKIVLLDNNLLASPIWRETLIDLSKLPVEVDINQGLDIRLLNTENLYWLKQLRMKTWRFAFDDLAYEDAVRQGLRLLKQQGIPMSKISFYVLVGFNNGNDSAIERMQILQSYGVSTYPMIYKDKSGHEPNVKYDWHGELKWRGARQNLRKFLRLVGRI